MEGKYSWTCKGGRGAKRPKWNWIKHPGIYLQVPGTEECQLWLSVHPLLYALGDRRTRARRHFPSIQFILLCFSSDLQLKKQSWCSLMDCRREIILTLAETFIHQLQKSLFFQLRLDVLTHKGRWVNNVCLSSWLGKCEPRRRKADLLDELSLWLKCVHVCTCGGIQRTHMSFDWCPSPDGAPLKICPSEINVSTSCLPKRISAFFHINSRQRLFQNWTTLIICLVPNLGLLMFNL